MAEENKEENLNFPKEQVDSTEHAWQPEEVEEPKQTELAEAAVPVEQVEQQPLDTAEIADAVDYGMPSEVKTEEVPQVETAPQEQIAVEQTPIETEMQNSLLGHEQIEEAKRATLTDLINEHGIQKGAESKLLNAALDYGQNVEQKLE